ncbi:isoprenyl transferase [Pectinatus frisingensis]|uniref:isoprenyl transferase n=1 Tax=Pectinatus frisingensis TaxID=865 RepID=UPI0018C5A19A|nr:isoprenyl transferase [Pectinatus frisingensis]
MWKKFLYKNEKNEGKAALDNLDKALLPVHVAVIMDGNGRWAKKRGLPRTAGHKKGVDALREIVKAASAIDIKYLTVYAFSTENWKRPITEVDFLMKLFSYYLDSEIEEMNKNNVRLKVVGYVEKLSENLQKQVYNAEDRTAENTGLTLNVGVNYGGRDEIVMAVRKIAQMAAAGKLDASAVDEQMVDNNLYTAYQPPVDLLIRTGGDMRISNFLLWQCAYAELWFTEKNWPDFKPDDFAAAVQSYQTRDRRFGGLSK